MLRRFLIDGDVAFWILVCLTGPNPGQERVRRLMPTRDARMIEAGENSKVTLQSIERRQQAW